MDTTAAINQLIQALANTREYQVLRSSKEAIKRDSHSDQMLAQFEKKRQMLDTSQLTQSQVQMIINELDRDYEKLVAIPAVKQYFIAAENFSKLLDSAMQTINDRLALGNR